MRRPLLNFINDHLPAVIYTVNFSVAAGYIASTSQPVTVVAGQVASLPNITDTLTGGAINMFPGEARHDNK